MGSAPPLSDLSSLREWPLPPARGAAVRARTTRRGKRGTADTHGVERLQQLHRDGVSIDAIAAALDAEGFRTPANRRWRPSSVARLISQPIRRHVQKPGESPNARRSTWQLSTATANRRRGTRAAVADPDAGPGQITSPS
ncbi:recombinase family protein [Geodermatophilus sp. SYSU D00710]